MRNASLPGSEEGDSQFGTNDSKSNFGTSGTRRTNDLPKTPANSQVTGAQNAEHYASFSPRDSTKLPGINQPNDRHQSGTTGIRKSDTKDVLDELQDRHRTGATGAINLDNQGAGTDRQFQDSSAPGRHGHTSIIGSVPGHTQFKPTDNTGGPLHFQHALGGQDLGNAMSTNNTSSERHQTGGTDLKHTGGTTHNTTAHTQGHDPSHPTKGGIHLKNTTEDRTAPHPQNISKRPDEGVKFAEAPAKDGPHSTAKPSVGDKVIGKTEKVIGKMTKDTELEEKGAARAMHGQVKN
jgi:hypothetical protein